MVFPDYEEKSPPDAFLTGPIIYTSLAVVAGLVAFFVFFRQGKKTKESEPQGPQALVVVSSKEFALPCVALASKALKDAGYGVVLASSTGGASQPEKDSMQTPVAKAAEEKHDKAWLSVLTAASQQKMPALMSLRPSKFVAVFIAGGRHALADLQQTDLKGKSPSPFCQDLQVFCTDVLRNGGVVGATGHGERGLPGLSDDEQVELGRFPLKPEVQAACAQHIFRGSVDSMAPQVVRDMVAALPKPDDGSEEAAEKEAAEKEAAEKE